MVDVTRKQFLHLGLAATAVAVGPACASDGDDDTAGGSDSGSGSSGAATTASGTAGMTTTSTAGTTASTTAGMGDDSSTGADSGSSDGQAAGCAGDPDATFDLHFHTLEVPFADVMAAADASYVAGGAHTHDVAISASAFATLLAEGKVIVSAAAGGVDGHTHAVTLNC
jgi:hypothetical protein